MESRKIVFQETALVALGQVICLGLMFGVYALLHRLQAPVIWGGTAGTVLAIANFFFMAVGTSLAADKAEAQNVKGGKALIQISFLARHLILFGLLAVCAISGYFDVFALVIPLVFTRPVLTVGEFFRKSGVKKP